MTDLGRSSAGSEGSGRVRRLQALAICLLAGRGAGPAAAQTMLARILLLGVNVASGVLSARLLGSAGKGEQTAIAMWPLLIPMCATLGLPTALVYSVRRTPHLDGSFFAAALMLSALVGVVAGILGFLWVPYWLGHLSGHVVLWSQAFMFLVPYGVTAPLALSIMEARGKFAAENAVVLASALSIVFLLIAFGVAGVANPVTVAMAYSLGGVPASLVAIVYAVRLVRPRVRGLVGAGRALLHYGIRQYGGDLFTVLSGNIDQFLAAGFLPPKMMGVYVVLASLCRLLNLVPQSIGVVLFPKIVGQPLRAISEDVGRAARVNLVMSLFPVLLIGLGGQRLIQIVYGYDFVTSGVVIWLLLGDALVGGISRLLAQTIMAIGRPGLVTLLNAAQFLVCVPLAVVLLPRYQITGVAAAMVISTTFRLLLTLASYPLILGLSRPRLVFWHSDLIFIRDRLRSLT
jgi:enterobacterial common antigen flippase